MEKKQITIKKIMISNNISPEVSDQKLAVFVGGNNSYYIENWTKGKYSLNWATVLWGPSWLLYRKMYKYAILFFSIYIIFIAILLVCGVKENHINGITYIAILLPYIFSANSFYLKHAIKVISKIESDGLSEKIERNKIRKSGGTSLLAPLLLLLFASIIAYIVPVASLENSSEMIPIIEEQAKSLVTEIIQRNIEDKSTYCTSLKIHLNSGNMVFFALAKLSNNKDCNVKIEVKNGIIYVSLLE